MTSDQISKLENSILHADLHAFLDAPDCSAAVLGAEMQLWGRPMLFCIRDCRHRFALSPRWH